MSDCLSDKWGVFCLLEPVSNCLERRRGGRDPPCPHPTLPVSTVRHRGRLQLIVLTGVDTETRPECPISCTPHLCIFWIEVTIFLHFQFAWNETLQPICMRVCHFICYTEQIYTNSTNICICVSLIWTFFVWFTSIYIQITILRIERLFLPPFHFKEFSKFTNYLEYQQDLLKSRQGSRRVTFGIPRLLTYNKLTQTCWFEMYLN